MLTSVAIPVISEESSILNSFLLKIIKNFNILVELDITISSIFLLGNFTQNIISFALSVLCYLFNTLFLVNYFDRKDILYVFSIKDHLFFSTFIIASFLLNSIFVQLSNLHLFTLADFILSLILFIWFLKNGFILIPNSSLRVYL
jgi:hypothetical protein